MDTHLKSEQERITGPAVRAPSVQRRDPRRCLHEGPKDCSGGVLGGLRASLLSPEFEWRWKWRWGESNPRPQAIVRVFSGRSRWSISPRGSHRRRTSRPARVRCPTAAPGRSRLR